MDAYALAQALFNNNQARFTLVLLMASVLSGILVALLPNNPERFRLGALGDWFTQALIYIGGGSLVRLVIWTAPEEYRQWATLLDTVVWGFIWLSLGGKFVSNLKIIFPKAPIPDWMGDKMRPEAEAKP